MNCFNIFKLKKRNDVLTVMVWAKEVRALSFSASAQATKAEAAM